MVSQEFQAFIFDLDGTLVDSATIVEQVMRNWCDENAIDYVDLQTSAYSSRTEDTVRSVAPHLDAYREAEKLEAIEREALKDLKEINGAASFLRQLPEDRWAVATSCSSSTARAKLDAANMPYPGVLIGADHVQYGKPHPEAYLVASKKTGFAPGDCLAFEDSETGVRSAISAGCQVIVVGTECQISDSQIIGRIDYFEGIEVTFSDKISMKAQVQCQ